MYWHIRKSCGVATLSAYITANRLRWLGHVGRMEEGRLPHIALFSSLHGDMTRPVGRPRHTWEKCVCADLKVLGQDEGSWEASCQIKSAWRKRLWDLTHPWESQRLVRCRRRTKQAIDKHVERYVVPFSGWEDGGSPVRLRLRLHHGPSKGAPVRSQPRLHGQKYWNLVHQK